MNDKKRPIEERIAAMIGRTAYSDLREGTGGTSPARIRDQDIAAALGMVSREVGKLAPLVLETYYGSTLIHQRALTRAWEEQQGCTVRDEIVISRMAGALAVREMAGVRHCSTEYAEYAYLIFSRREALQDRVKAAGAWLDGIRSAGLAELRRCLRDTWAEQARQRVDRGAA